MKDLTVAAINDKVNENVDQEFEITSDSYRGYNKLKEVIADHLVIIEPDKTKSAKQFPWVNKSH